MSPRPAVGRRPLPTSPFKAPTVVIVAYEVGDWVNSDRHGLGRVISVEGDTSAPESIVVDHRGGQVRRFTLPSSRVTKLGDED